MGGARAFGRRAAITALASLVLALATGSARADACGSCPEPTADDLGRMVPGFALVWRSALFGAERDYLETDAGECTYALAGPPKITLAKTWLVLRGQGSVWNCPWGTSEDVISIEIASGDSTGWSVDASLSGGLKSALLSLLLDIDVSASGTSTLHEVRQVSKKLEAGFGHVIDWSGYFQLADVVADLDVEVTRRWSWWTKNDTTGAEVHQSGSVWMNCGNEHAQLTRRASIGYSFHLLDSPCDAGSAEPTDLGNFPRHPDPVVTPDDGPPVPGNDEGDPPPEEPLDPRADDPTRPPEPQDAHPQEPEDPAEEPREGPPTEGPRESGELGDAPTGPLPELPEGFGGPEAPAASVVG